MDREALKKQLRIDEGDKLTVYVDSKGYPTAGVGHLLSSSNDFGLGDRVTREQVERWLAEDIEQALIDCTRLWSGFWAYPETVQQVLANMSFNLGYRKLAKFTDLRAAVTREDWAMAAIEMEDSLWYREVKNRSKRLVQRMRAVAMSKHSEA